MKIGVQLYSARNYLVNNEGIEQAFKKSKEHGYECLQYSGAPNGCDFDADFIASMIKKYDLPIFLTHISFEKFKNNLSAEIEKHKKIGCKNMGLGMMPGDMTDDKNVVDFVKTVKPIIKTIKNAGLNFFYHNHHQEFNRMKNGVTVFEYLFNELPDMNFTLDVHWLQRGGVSILEYIQKCKNRIECVHLKDFKMSGNEPKFAPIGQGNFNWQDILKTFEKNGAKYAFVEQDDAPDHGDPFEQLKISMDYLKTVKY